MFRYRCDDGEPRQPSPLGPHTARMPSASRPHAPARRRYGQLKPDRRRALELLAGAAATRSRRTASRSSSMVELVRDAAGGYLVKGVNTRTSHSITSSAPLFMPWVNPPAEERHRTALLYSGLLAWERRHERHRPALPRC